MILANGYLETPRSTVELLGEVWDIVFKKRFIVMTNLTSPLNGLLFLQGNSTILDMRQRLINFLPPCNSGMQITLTPALTNLYQSQ